MSLQGKWKGRPNADRYVALRFFEKISAPFWQKSKIIVIPKVLFPSLLTSRLVSFFLYDKSENSVSYIISIQTNRRIIFIWNSICKICNSFGSCTYIFSNHNRVFRSFYTRSRKKNVTMVKCLRSYYVKQTRRIPADSCRFRIWCERTWPHNARKQLLAYPAGLSVERRVSGLIVNETPSAGRSFKNSIKYCISGFELR